MWIVSTLVSSEELFMIARIIQSTAPPGSGTPMIITVNRRYLTLVDLCRALTTSSCFSAYT